ncbi:hypothetical protein C5167_046408 [Papaver somniferum]|uniref:Uncharacterized protein n=1 Tax=Papaver somniferum TaxID=3469 RepID=A0A4Y7LHD8_PAPSO|nr:hypothetical protein C5167_046408 [Papaver somniferum]
MQNSEAMVSIDMPVGPSEVLVIARLSLVILWSISTDLDDEGLLQISLEEVVMDSASLVLLRFYFILHWDEGQ